MTTRPGDGSDGPGTVEECRVVEASGEGVGVDGGVPAGLEGRVGEGVGLVVVPAVGEGEQFVFPLPQLVQVDLRCSIQVRS